MGALLQGWVWGRGGGFHNTMRAYSGGWVRKSAVDRTAGYILIKW